MLLRFRLLAKCENVTREPWKSNLQKGIKRELKELILCFAYWVEDFANPVLFSEPHQYCRPFEHASTYPDFRPANRRTNSFIGISLVDRVPGIQSAMAVAELSAGFIN